MKQILFATDPQLDYGLDSLLVGLYEISEVDIYEYPEKLSLHGIVHSGYDLPGNPGGGMTGPPGFIINSPLPGPFHTKEEIFDIFPNYDLIIMGTRDYSHRAISELCNAKNISLEKLSNVIIADAEDHPAISTELINKYRPVVFAKRELDIRFSLAAYEGHYGLPIVPCPFGAFLRGLPEVDDSVKEWDIFVALGQTHPGRNDVISHLLDMVRKDIIPGPKSWIATNDNAEIYQANKDLMRGMLDWRSYMEHQAKAKIGISVPGFGRDTLHHWELTSFATLCMYIHPGIYIPYPFESEKNCVDIERDLVNLEVKIRFYLQYEEERDAIAQAGKAHCREFHSTKARAGYLVDTATKVMGGEKIRWDEYGL